MIITRRTWVQAHVRRMPARPAEYEAVIAELKAAWEQDRKFWDAVAVMVEEIALALDHDMHELQRVA